MTVKILKSGRGRVFHITDISRLLISIPAVLHNFGIFVAAHIHGRLPGKKMAGQISGIFPFTDKGPAV